MMAKEGTLFGKPRGDVIKRPGAFSAKAKAAGKSTGAYATSVLKEGSKASTRTKRQAALAKTLSSIRKGKTAIVLALLVAALATRATAATKACASGTLAPTPATTTGPTTDVIMARGAPALLVQVTSSAGTGTAQVEMSCDATNWAVVQNSVMTLGAAPANSQAVSVLYPTTCVYRVNVTACTGCSVTVLYACSGP